LTGGAVAFSWTKGYRLSITWWWNGSWPPSNQCLHKVDVSWNYLVLMMLMFSVIYICVCELVCFYFVW